MTTLSGTGSLLRFSLRRERVALPWWLLGVAVLVLNQSIGSQNFYGTAEKLARLRQTVEANTAVVAMSGPTELLATIGGEVVFEIFAYVAVVVALMNMFLVGRHTRSDEETGRAELIRSASVGRRASLAAALLLAALANVAAAAIVFVVAAGTGLPAGGSALFGVATGAVGLSFAGLSAVAVQIFENHRSAYGAVGAGIGAAYVLRAAGDAGNGVASWLSPIGWGQRTFPYAGDRWWPLLLPIMASVLLATLAVWALDRRDFGAGLLPARLGRPTASALLTSSLGLAIRLHRGSLIGWAIGLFLLGLAYGSFANSIEQYVADNPEFADYLPGGVASVVNSYLALTTMFCSLITVGYGVSSALRARGEETSGRAEMVLATPASRWAWLGSHLAIALLGSAMVLVAAGCGLGLSYALAISDLAQVPRMMAVALVYVPAMWVVVAVAALGFGWFPRAAAPTAWAVLGLCVVVALFADVIDIPAWVKDLSPFSHTPQAPLDNVTAGPLVVVGAIVAGLVLAGLVGFRRRDVG